MAEEMKSKSLTNNDNNTNTKPKMKIKPLSFNRIVLQLINLVC